MLATVASATLLGVDGIPVTVEVHVAGGLPGFTIVGLPDASCREARDRVRAALLSSGFAWPDRRITVNLAPTACARSAPALDLAIAIGVLVAGGQLPVEAVGERASSASSASTARSGRCRARCRWSMPSWPTRSSSRRTRRPRPSSPRRHRVRTAPDLEGPGRGDDRRGPVAAAPRRPAPAGPSPPPDLADVRGHPLARTALEVAAAGGHHLLMVGPPGAGKTMLAQRLPGLLPDARRRPRRWRPPGSTPRPASRCRRRPRAPAPVPGAAPRRSARWRMVGGGSARMRPGEISLAHGGVLFLDELGEFAADGARRAAPAARGGRRPRRRGPSAGSPSRPGSCWWRP